MQVYFACTGKKEPMYIVENGFKKILLSFHYYKKNVDLIEQLKNLGGHIFIDSGAFSAYNAGAEVNIDEYSRFLEKIKPAVCVSLDVIGNAEATLENWKYQNENFDIKCMPTFHMGESLDYLNYYLDRCDYIALGGMVGAKNVDIWLDKIWTHIIRNKPEMKVHGFGMTTVEYIYKYPWFSFDSSTFKAGKRFGRVLSFNGKRLIQKTVKGWSIETKAEHEDIFSNNAKRNMMMDLQNCKAYEDLVEYLTKRNNNAAFANQTSLF